jgi:hypothetical protein
LNDTSNEEDNWLTRCEAFFLKLRHLGVEYETSDIYGKRIVLQSIGAKFTRKHGNLAVQLQKPFSYVLEPESAKEFTRTAKKGLFKPQMASVTPEMSSWLRGRDSNPD